MIEKQKVRQAVRERFSGVPRSLIELEILRQQLKRTEAEYMIECLEEMLKTTAEKAIDRQINLMEVR